MAEIKIESTGITLNYTDAPAEGSPVVLIHGWPLSQESWAEQTAALHQAGHRVITFDRRGFGKSDKPDGRDEGYDYDSFAADLAGLLEQKDLRDVTLVGFSMGGGEVARYLGAYGDERIAKAVFAAAVPPFLLKTDDNPEGGLAESDVQGMEQGVQDDRATFLDDFSHGFFSAGDELKVTDDQRKHAFALAEPASDQAVHDCIGAFSRTDFRADLATIKVPTLVIHGDSDATVPFEVSGRRTADSVADAKLVVIAGGPHGCNVSHADEFNAALLEFIDS